MTNKEAIRILGLECDDWETSHCTSSERREAFEMAITALDQLDNNSTKPDNLTQFNGIESKVKGLTACRVPDDDCISRADVEQTVEDNILCYTHSDRPIDQDPDTECHKAIRTALRMLRKDLRKLPSVQPVAKDTNVLNNDTISRQAAIDELDPLFESLAIDKIKALPSVQPTQPNTPNTLRSLDCIDRQEAIDKAKELFDMGDCYCDKYSIVGMINSLPSVQPEPLSDAYMKAVWTWLLDYQIKAVELKGRYTPYEVLSWVANDWRKEHERSD